MQQQPEVLVSCVPLVLMALSALLGFGLSVAGIIAIATSKGRLKGMGFAIAGLAISLLFVPATLVFMFLYTGKASKTSPSVRRATTNAVAVSEPVPRRSQAVVSLPPHDLSQIWPVVLSATGKKEGDSWIARSRSDIEALLDRLGFNGDEAHRFVEVRALVSGENGVRYVVFDAVHDVEYFEEVLYPSDAKQSKIYLCGRSALVVFTTDTSFEAGSILDTRIEPSLRSLPAVPTEPK